MQQPLELSLSLTIINRHSRAHIARGAIRFIHTNDPLGGRGEALESGQSGSIGSVGITSSPEGGDEFGSIRVCVFLGRCPVLMKSATVPAIVGESRGGEKQLTVPPPNVVAHSLESVTGRNTGLFAIRSERGRVGAAVA